MFFIYQLTVPNYKRFLYLLFGCWWSSNNPHCKTIAVKLSGAVSTCCKGNLNDTLFLVSFSQQLLFSQKNEMKSYELARTQNLL